MKWKETVDLTVMRQWQDMRYSFIENICEQSVVKCQVSKEYERSVQIDSVLTNRYLALPVFAGIMVFIFWIDIWPVWLIFKLSIKCRN